MLALLLADVPALPDLPSTTTVPLLPILIGAGVLLLFLVLFLALRRSPHALSSGKHGENLAEYPPPRPVTTCQLFYLNEPVRVRLVIVAPQGRRDLPPDLDNLLDHAIRGLGHVFDQDKPAWRNWPPQLSWRGFLPTFTSYVHLPNAQDEPSQYQLVCGQIRVGGQMIVLGLVLMADEVFHRQPRLLEAHQWVEQFRVDWYG